MHVISPVFLRLLPFKERLYFWRFHKEHHTCMIESQLWHWETDLVVYSVQSSNRKFRMFHNFYPFEDTSTLVKAFFLCFHSFLVRTYHCVHTGDGTVYLLQHEVTQPPASFTVHFTDTFEVVFPRLLCECSVPVSFILINVICIIQTFYL